MEHCSHVLLLSYLESERSAASVQPWFWVALLFFGRVCRSVADEWFMFKQARRAKVDSPARGGELTCTLQTRVSVRIQAIITELVFEHALRIRMKAETGDTADSGKSSENTAVATPDNASQVGENSDGDGESSEGSQAGAGAPRDSATSSSNASIILDSAPATIKCKGKAAVSDGALKTTAEQTKPAEDKKEANNLVGRINNLVSSDLNNLEPIAMFFPYTGTFALLVVQRSP